MKSTFTKICFIFLSFIISFGAFGHGTIIFPNVEHGDGFIDVKIYDSKESFLDEDRAIESVRKSRTPLSSFSGISELPKTF